METTTQEQRINNAQRGALAELIRKRYEQRIDAARQAENELERQIVDELARKFGIATIDAQIVRLEKEVANLQERKQELGFSKQYDETYRIAGGRARALLEAKVKARSVAVRNLRLAQMQAEQSVWLAATVDEAQRLVENANGKEAG